MIGAVIRSERRGNLTAGSVVNWFRQTYRQLELVGCSSHSGRRTFTVMLRQTNDPVPNGRFALPGMTQLEPLSQGSLSSLCGLYSAMNGIRLALYPQRLSKHQTEELYRQGATHLARARQLARVLGVGMPQDKWLDLTQSLLAHANDATESSLCLKQSCRPRHVAAAAGPWVPSGGPS